MQGSKTKPGVRVIKLNIPDDRPKRDPKLYLDDAWGKLKPAIKAIFLDKPRHFHCSDLNKSIEIACRTNSGEALYKLILDECGVYIFQAIQSLESHCDDDPADFIPVVETCLVDFRGKLQFLSDIVGGQKFGLKPFKDLGNELFIKYLCLPHKVRDKLLSIILDLTRDHRSGKSVDMTQYRNLMNMFDGPAFYESRFFEKPFVDCAIEFYSVEAMQFHEQSDIHDYLKHVDIMLYQEKRNCRDLYFFQEFQDSLMEAVKTTLFKNHASAIIEKGFVMFMDERRHYDLEKMYYLFSQTGLLGMLHDAFNYYIRQTGQKILKEGSSLLEFKKSIDKICLSCFSQDASFQETANQCLRDLGLPIKESKKKSRGIQRFLHIQSA